MPEIDLSQLGAMAQAGDGAWGTWVMPVLLGLGLASATGLRTFLPLLMLAGAARFGLFGIELNGAMSWISSDMAILALGLAAMVEFAGDKIPVVDNALSTLGLITRPVAGAVAAGSVFVGVDPTTAAVAGLIVGAPTALAFNAAQGGTRAASTVGTAGLANPFLSFLEDVLAFFTVLLAFLAPILVPVLLIVLAIAAVSIAKRIRRRRERLAAPAS